MSLRALLTTATPGSQHAARGLIRSMRQHEPDLAVHVLVADDVDLGDDLDVEVLRATDLVTDGLPVGDILTADDQAALLLPCALQRVAQSVGPVCYLAPGLLLARPLAEISELIDAHPIVLAARVLSQERHSVAAELDRLARHGEAVSERVLAVDGSVGDQLEAWHRTLRQVLVDAHQRRPSMFTRRVYDAMVGQPGAAVAGQRSLMSFADHAAVEAGRATGPACSLVSCDELWGIAAERVRKGTSEVQLELLLLNVHDARPLAPFLEVIDEAVERVFDRHARTTPFDALCLDIRRATDPLGRRWPAGEVDAFLDWLYETDALGTTRIAHLHWRDDDALARTVPNPRRDPSPLRAWNDAHALSVLGADLYDRSVPRRVPSDDDPEPASSWRGALEWRMNVLRGLMPGHTGRTGAGPGTEEHPFVNALRWRVNLVRGLVPGHERRTQRKGSRRPIQHPTRIAVPPPPAGFGSRPHDLTIMGLFRSESGLGQAARASLAALRHLGREYSHIDTSDLYPSRNAVDPELGPDTLGALGDVNLIHANAGELVAWPHLVFRHRLPGRYNVGSWYWETANLPDELRAGFDTVDELWLASSYLADVFGQYGRVPVKVIGLASDLPDLRAVDRSSQGLHDDEFVFLFVYDALSAHGRKNPEKALEAFVKAFAPDFSGVRFVMKVSNLAKFPKANAVIRSYVERYRAITLIDDYLPRSEVLDLMAMADVYISLHASEGYGLTLLEAMALGTPVICTAYSGNMEFSTTDNSWLVDYTMMATPEQTGPYPPGSIWASPDVDSAADLMRAARDNPTDVARKRERAIVDAREAASLERYAERLDAELRRVL